MRKAVHIIPSLNNHENSIAGDAGLRF